MKSRLMRVDYEFYDKITGLTKEFNNMTRNLNFPGGKINNTHVTKFIANKMDWPKTSIKIISGKNKARVFVQREI